MEPLEIEVKIHLPDIRAVRARILDIGAVSKGRVFESNIRFEDERRTLMKDRSLLRLRKDTNTTLTFKSTPPATDNQFKVRRELEVEVSDFSVMKAILESLGFHEEQVYEKWRETFVSDDTILCLDTMPYGDFLEIEGSRAGIRDVARRLGLKWEKRILTNYLVLFDVIRQKLNLPFHDVTFDNFADVSVDFGALTHLFEA